MVVTKVSIDSYTPKSEGTCAEVSVVLDNSLVIHKCSVIKGEKGYFVAMPNTGHTRLYNNQKRYDDLVHPVSKALQAEITTVVLNEYQKFISDKSE